MKDLTVVGLDDIELQNTTIDEIDSEEVHLIFVGLDISGSMQQWIPDMTKSLIEFKGALVASKEESKILVAQASFNSSINIGGYKKIGEFDVSYTATGGTALFDVIVEGKGKLVQYIDHLKSQGMRVKAVFAVFSDGEDTSSRRRANTAKLAVDELNAKEITTAFISFGRFADTVATGLGFKNLLKISSSASELRKGFNCLSKSVIESSKSVVADKDQFFVV